MPAMLSQRLFFGTLLIAGWLGVFWLDQWSAASGYLPAGAVMLAAFLLMIALGSHELVGIFRAKGIQTDAWLVAVGAMAACVLAYMPGYLEDRRGVAVGGQAVAAVCATAAAAVLLAAMIRHSYPKRQTQGAAASAAATLFCVIYMGGMAGFYVALRHRFSAWVIVGVIMVIKSCDSGAYFTGRAIGRHKLISWLSPGKTVEGLVGGLITSGLAALGLAAWANAASAGGAWGGGPYQMPLWYAALGGVVIGGLGHVGDLVASLLKRDAGVKDSGRLIPGMGGLLDLVDSTLLAAPLAYWWLMLAPGR
jgi:phosphatidate cytidylyltransferase